MPCYDQSGVRSIVLYENIDFELTYAPQEDKVITITNNGNTIEIDSSLRPDYSDQLSPGENYSLMNQHNIKWYEFDLIEGKNKQDTLRNYFGWYALLTFNSGKQYLINSPIFNNTSSSLTSSNTHTWEINLSSEVETYGDLIEYEEGELEGIGYMEIENTFIVS